MSDLLQARRAVLQSGDVERSSNCADECYQEPTVVERLLSCCCMSPGGGKASHSQRHRFSSANSTEPEGFPPAKK